MDIPTGHDAQGGTSNYAGFLFVTAHGLLNELEK